MLLAWPLYGFGGLFLQDLANDAIRAPMMHQLQAWQLLHGKPLDELWGWSWPRAQPVSEVMPPSVDVWLSAPLWWLLGWPGAWRAAQVGAVLVNGLGAAWLARSLGARGPGLVVAGLVSALCVTSWREILLGHPNTALPGLAAAALAAFLDALRGGWGRVVVAALLGAAAASLFPPWLVLLTPPALSWAWERRGEGAPLRGAAALCGGILLATPVLLAMGGMRAGKGLEDFADHCPTAGMVVLGQDLARLGPPAWTGEVAPWMAAGAWLGLAAPLLLGRRGGALLPALLWAGLLALLSLGPCPAWGPALGTEPTPGFAALGVVVGVLNNLGRGLAVSQLLLGLALGLALDAGWEARGARRAAAVALVGLALAGAAWPLRGELLDGRHYKRVPQSAQAAFLAEQAPGASGGEPVVIADLPYDQAGQFVVALQTLGVARVNPPTPFTPRDRRDPFVNWLHDLGEGRIPGAPTAAQAAASGVRWVFHDRSRCAPPHMRSDAPCAAAVRAALTRLLGPPRELDGDVVVWAVAPTPAPAR